VRANVSLEHHCRLLSSSFAQTVAQAIPVAETIDEAIQQLDSSQRWSVQDVDMSPDQGAELAQAIIDGDAIAVSNGSFKEDYGTAGWTLRGQDDEIFMTGVNVTPGKSSTQSAFRSELSGLYGVVTAVEVVCKVFTLTTGQITVACDGESALDYVFDWNNRFIRASTPHLDLIVSIRRMIQASPIRWKYRHVKGHQDDYAGPLDRWASLNVEMDSLAKAHWLQATEGEYVPVQAIKNEPWSVWASEVKFIHPLKQDIYSHVHNPIVDEYWYSRDRYQPETQSQWDWQALAAAMKKTTITRRHWLTKHTSGWCSVGVMAKR
jgi:hypothetical protein